MFVLLEQHKPRHKLVGYCGILWNSAIFCPKNTQLTVICWELQEWHHYSQTERQGFFLFMFIFTNMVSTAWMMPQCSGLKKQKADASVIKTIKPAAAPSAIVRDRSNEWKKESKRNFEKVAVCR